MVHNNQLSKYNFLVDTTKVYNFTLTLKNGVVLDIEYIHYSFIDYKKLILTDMKLGVTKTRTWPTSIKYIYIVCFCWIKTQTWLFTYAGYEEQAMHSVIGVMLKSRFAGQGSGPRPNEIIQVMLGDHDVRISYWKAWRSREVALEYAKGSCVSSYKLLPDYLHRLVVRIQAL